jgi:ribosomal-protein-alanine N-acetyltransferase
LSEILPEDSFFDFKCPYCEAINSFPASAVRTLQECASCTESLIVPESGVEVGGRLPQTIVTPRLVLRRFVPDDAAPILKIIARDEFPELPVTETDIDQWIESQRAARFTRSENGVYLAVEIAEGQELAGYVLPYYSDRLHKTAGFTLTLIQSRRRQGLGLEIARAVIDFLFDGLCVRRVSVSCLGQNAAARRMLEKAGMRHEGEFIKSWYDGHDWVDMSGYAMLKEERPSPPAS